MTCWKDFKNWLEREVVISEGLKVKIRSEKRMVYGKLSETVLTNFMDSLEATLDKNSSYHLFPEFNKCQEFGGLFDKQMIFGKKTNQEEIKDNDCDLLKKLFSEWSKIGSAADEKPTKSLYEEKNDEILQLKRHLEFLEESRNEMVSDREGKIEELENQLENKQKEINWLQEKLKKILGKEQYQTQIEVNYPAKFRS